MKKAKGNLFFKLLAILFIIYVALFIAGTTGYYEKTLRDKTVLTQEKLEEFESDIALGKPVDINSYLPEEKDYSNFLTKSANFITRTLGTIVEEKTADVFKLIKSWFIG